MFKTTSRNRSRNPEIQKTCTYNPVSSKLPSFLVLHDSLPRDTTCARSFAFIRIFLAFNHIPYWSKHRVLDVYLHSTLVHILNACPKRIYLGSFKPLSRVYDPPYDSK